MKPGERKGNMGRYTRPPSRHAKQRKCLKCGKMFHSWGPANRICGPCKGNQPSLPYSPELYPPTLELGDQVGMVWEGRGDDG